MNQESAARREPGLRFDRMEWAGAFGDLGTLIPFVIAYLAVVRVDPVGLLYAFGLAAIAVGLIYRTPFPVQPMKAIGAAAATSAVAGAMVTPQAVVAATLLTGLVWLLLGVTGLAGRLATWIRRPLAIGIILGLGIGFMLEGIRMIATGWWAGGIALGGTILLLANRVVPAMFVVLLFGAAVALIQDPSVLGALAAAEPAFQWPRFALAGMTASDWLVGALVLAVPQLPLTFGNAVVAVTEENNRLFPDRPVSERKVALSTGVMNACGAVIGGIPMCHGAGGMAGHVRFGARTGGAPVILGVLLVAVAAFFSDSIAVFLRLFPEPVLGAILFLTGAQLALGSCDFSRDKVERFLTLVTAAFAIWNVGVAFAVGLTLQWLSRRGAIRL